MNNTLKCLRGYQPADQKRLIEDTILSLSSLGNPRNRPHFTAEERNIRNKIGNEALKQAGFTLRDVTMGNASIPVVIDILKQELL